MLKKLALISLICLPIIIASCSSDDPPPPDPTPGTPRLVAEAATAAVSATNVDDAQWNNATAQTIELTRGSLSTPARPGGNKTAQRAATEVTIKALVYSDTLYLRLNWVDSTYSKWPDAFEVTGAKPTTWTNREGLYFEDQLLVMFDTANADTIDTWYWRVATTAVREIATNTIFGFAEGVHKVGTNLNSDNSTLDLVLDNPHRLNFPSLPNYIHQDSSSYNHFLLYEEDIYQSAGFDTLWTVGQMVPGWRTDSTVAGDVKAAARASRWDIWALSEWMDAADEYTVVLRRPMNTGFSDDYDFTMIDSARVRLGVSDDFYFDLDIGTQDQSFSDYFWIIF